ncbi:MAG: hypothetical protein JWM34_4292 [Ilumatobacteraceae bacterium]|nr:hypothetical protein [Ilumatobacteraceae bacterium]
MCDSHFTRREALVTTGLAAAAAVVAGRVIGAGTAVAAVAAGTPVLPVQVRPGLFVLPRDSWGADLPARGAIAPETVQFLLVHHTASSNSYGAGGAPGVLRSVFAYHTSSAKGWPDVCYEFFVDHDGIVYEGRTGALAGPVRADATGGSQGFAQLVCLIGDFSDTEPTDAMMGSLTRVLAWLADRYSIDTSPGATTSFVSRGSQRYAAGATVTTPTIAGHRDMSYTECPGDHVYIRIVDGLRDQVHAQRTAWSGALYQADRLGPTTP